MECIVSKPQTIHNTLPINDIDTNFININIKRNKLTKDIINDWFESICLTIFYHSVIIFIISKLLNFKYSVFFERFFGLLYK